MVRRATIEDLWILCDLLEALRQESLWRTLSGAGDRLYAASVLMEYLVNPNELILLAECDGEPIGLCGAEVTAQRFLPNMQYLQEWALYVRPAYRGLGYGRALWQEATRWGQAQGAIGSVRGKIIKGRAIEHYIWHSFVTEGVVHG